MKKVIDSAMETMHLLGEPVARIKEAVQEFFSQPTPMSEALDQEAERIEEVFKEELIPNPLPLATSSRAFPDSFYYRPPTVAERAQTKEILTQALTPPQAPQWIPYKPHLVREYPGQWCHCGHKWEEHMPCCVYLVQGCSCDEFMPVPMGHAEGA